LIVTQRYSCHEALFSASFAKCQHNLVEEYLSWWTSTGDKSYECASTDIDEALGYDFVTREENSIRYICVKSTEGSFDSPVHISYSELLMMREAVLYDLYRVYNVSEMSTSLRIARGMKQFAETALAALEQLPDDVRSDSISVLPEILNFEDPLDIEILYDEE
jgi:hypothetical protein